MGAWVFSRALFVMSVILCVVYVLVFVGGRRPRLPL